ncbi:MAG: PhaM family polyhydroxyalkanoate granule multifunctional regulatory protein [Polaromonas sp.]
MSNANSPSFPDFGKLVPGFDFLQNLAKQATGSATQALPQLPNLANWIAPTLNVEELDKRVQELKAVQFWLDQNAAALKATIQALEVQKMTLATLKGMNFNMGEVANAFKLKVGDSVAGGVQRMADMGKNFPGLEVPASTYQANKARVDAEPEAAAKPSSDKAETGQKPASVVDPMQWWGALTQQFQTIAAEAMKEAAKTSALDATKSMATGIAKDAVKTATDMATGLAKGMAETASKTMSGSWPTTEATKPSPRAAPKTADTKTAASKTAASKPGPKAAVKAKPKAPARRTAGAAARKTTR